MYIYVYKRNSEGVHTLHLCTKTTEDPLTCVKCTLTLGNGLWRGEEKSARVHTATSIGGIRVKC